MSALGQTGSTLGQQGSRSDAKVIRQYPGRLVKQFRTMFGLLVEFLGDLVLRVQICKTNRRRWEFGPRACLTLFGDVPGPMFDGSGNYKTWCQLWPNFLRILVESPQFGKQPADSPNTFPVHFGNQS